MEKTIQEIFDALERKSQEVDDAKKAFDDTQLPDLSGAKFISAEQADEHLIACIEHERYENELERVSVEWTEIQDLLVEKLCKINTKVMVKDKEENSYLLIHCEGGSIIIEEYTNNE